MHTLLQDPSMSPATAPRAPHIVPQRNGGILDNPNISGQKWVGLIWKAWKPWRGHTWNRKLSCKFDHKLRFSLMWIWPNIHTLQSFHHGNSNLTRTHVGIAVFGQTKKYMPCTCIYIYMSVWSLEMVSLIVHIYIFIYTFTLKVKWPMLLTAAVIIHTSPSAKISGIFGACTC